ncbi:MAG: L-histidine N(alpha)-methyltransferase [Lewinellaceae bacterium]|nr:L-histidine N(alpha)-methyltransferase [Lewinellaceae bacterium]
MKSNIIEKQSTTSITLEVDPEIANWMVGEIPANRSQCSLYLDSGGGKAWLSLVDAGVYKTNTSYNKIEELIIETLKIETLDVNAFISFGPGDGGTDYKILSSLLEPIHYIPIDISNVLLLRSILKLRDIAHIPFGILGDFEEGFSFIRNKLEKEVNAPIIVSMIGNTLGNLDINENPLLANLAGFLKKGDYLVLHVSVYSQSWEFKSDYWVQKENHTSKMRQWIAQGISRKTNKEMEEVLRNYAELEITERIHSDIPNSRSINFSYRGDKILSIRRYDWASFIGWIKQNMDPFEIIREGYFIEGDRETGSACILLKRS